MPEYIRESFLTAQATRLQRERQQGLGKPIISAEVSGTRFVAIGNSWLILTSLRHFTTF